MWEMLELLELSVPFHQAVQRYIFAPALYPSQSQAGVQEADAAIYHALAPERVGGGEVGGCQRRHMQPDSMRELEIEEVVGGGGYGGVAVVRVPAGGGEEVGEDMVHEVLHRGRPFMVAVALSRSLAQHTILWSRY